MDKYWHSTPYLSGYQTFFCFYCWLLFALSLIAYENLLLIEVPSCILNQRHPHCTTAGTKNLSLIS
jgi:hypothetical protein